MSSTMILFAIVSTITVLYMLWRVARYGPALADESVCYDCETGDRGTGADLDTDTDTDTE